MQSAPCGRHLDALGRLVHAPRGSFWPVAEGLGGPGGGFVGMAGGARIGNFVFVGCGRRDEREGVSVNFYVRDGGFDLRHVAGDALAAGRAWVVVGMGLESRYMGTV